MKRLLTIVLSAVITYCLFAGCGTSTSKDGRYKILTTVYPVYDWLKYITEGAENVEVNLLLDDGKDLHSYQPTAEDMVKIRACDLFVYVGGESEKWVNDAAAVYFTADNEKKKVSLLDLLGDQAKQEETVEDMQVEDDEKTGLDEHVWLSVKNARQFCAYLTDTLKTADTANAEVYETNGRIYREKLDAIDARYTAALTEFPKKYDTLLFADRFPFRYLMDDYHLKYYAAFAGCSAESEASFETVAFLVNKLDELSLPAVLTIDGSDKKLAKTIIETSKFKDTAILTLNSMQSETDERLKTDGDYLSIMNTNLETLKLALAVDE